MRKSGTLTISDGGFQVWHSSEVWFYLAQLRDNILIATTSHEGTANPLVIDICGLLSHIWLLCDCITPKCTTCTGAYPKLAWATPVQSAQNGQGSNTVQFLHSAGLPTRHRSIASTTACGTTNRMPGRKPLQHLLGLSAFYS